MTIHNVLAVIVGATFHLCLACSREADTSERVPQGSAGDDAGVCVGGRTVYAAPESASEECLEGAAIAVGCSDPAASGLDWGCATNGATRYWFHRRSSMSLASGWTACPGATAQRPPRPCFAACAPDDAPTSMCSPEQTREQFRCGATDSERDENCCRRPTCKSAADCAADEDCKRVGTIAGMECYAGPDGGCSCGATPGGQERDVCVPK
jgi:hypothetical protein